MKEMRNREVNQKKLQSMKRHHNRNIGFLWRSYTRQVQELYDFEKQFLLLLSQFRAAPLKEALHSLVADHAHQTSEHIARLEEIMKRLNISPRAAHFRKTSHLLTKLRRFLKTPAQPQDTRHQAAILSALHKVEAFEISSYAATHSYARLLSFHDDLAPLEKSYGEEKAMEQRIENFIRQQNDPQATEFLMTA
ncbi:MAG: hypothetical protein JWM16_139 [Verrucomicrobiales bacterium]|nr:hypothetical protein [Verrucomicrobiales bacterium]